MDLSLENKKSAQYLTSAIYYGSLHGGDVVQFAFVDGSVRSLNKNIDLVTFQSMSTMKGEEVIDSNAL